MLATTTTTRQPVSTLRLKRRRAAAGDSPFAEVDRAAAAVAEIFSSGTRRRQPRPPLQATGKSATAQQRQRPRTAARTAPPADRSPVGSKEARAGPHAPGTPWPAHSCFTPWRQPSLPAGRAFAVTRDTAARAAGLRPLRSRSPLTRLRALAGVARRTGAVRRSGARVAADGNATVPGSVKERVKAAGQRKAARRSRSMTGICAAALDPIQGPGAKPSSVPACGLYWPVRVVPER